MYIVVLCSEDLGLELLFQVLELLKIVQLLCTMSISLHGFQVPLHCAFCGHYIVPRLMICTYAEFQCAYLSNVRMQVFKEFKMCAKLF